jgi:hypothetical protein
VTGTALFQWPLLFFRCILFQVGFHALQATLQNVTANALDRTERPIDDFDGLRKLFNTPVYIRSLVKFLVFVGRALPFCTQLGERVRFLPSLVSPTSLVFFHQLVFSDITTRIHVHCLLLV